ncbi:MAG: hypothetical protein MJ181_02090 [Treponema sp.]|nr:hypothetical protein [Treponema sp.]
MKRTTKLILSGLLVLATALPVFARETETDSITWDQNSTALGTSVTFVPEHPIYGLSVQHWWNDFGIDFTAGGHYNKDWNGNPESYICASIKPQYQVFKTDPTRKSMTKVYIWGLAGVTGSISTNSVYVDPTNPDNYATKEVTETPFDAIAGFGFGAEIICWNHLSIPLEVGFAGGFPCEPAFGFTGSCGIRFRF